MFTKIGGECTSGRDGDAEEAVEAMNAHRPKVLIVQLVLFTVILVIVEALTNADIIVAIAMAIVILFYFFLAFTAYKRVAKATSAAEDPFELSAGKVPDGTGGSEDTSDAGSRAGDGVHARYLKSLQEDATMAIAEITVISLGLLAFFVVMVKQPSASMDALLKISLGILIFYFFVIHKRAARKAASAAEDPFELSAGKVPDGTGGSEDTSGE